MKIVDSNKYGVTSEEKVADFERKIEIQLPTDYREFLLTHNGGKPEPDSFNIGNNDTSSVRSFYGLHSDPYSNLAEHLDIYKGRISGNVIPITGDPCGNQVCLGVKGKHRGKVYFWDHELEGARHALTRIADDFNKFLNSLFRWVDPDETFIEKVVRKNDLKQLNLILLNGFNINKKDKDGMSLIEEAVRLNRLDMAKFLVEKGADLGDSLDIARTNLEFFPKFKEITEYLETLSSE